MTPARLNRDARSVPERSDGEASCAYVPETDPGWKDASLLQLQTHYIYRTRVENEPAHIYLRYREYTVV